MLASITSQNMDPRIDSQLYSAKNRGDLTASVTIEFKTDGQKLQLPMLSDLAWLDNSGRFLSATLDLTKLNDLAGIGDMERAEAKKISQINKK